MEAIKTWLNVDEVCEYLGVRPATVYSWVSERQFPHYKFRGLLRFKRQDIDSLLENGRVESVQEYARRSHKKKGGEDGAAQAQDGQGREMGT